jgi:urea carboxylase
MHAGQALILMFNKVLIANRGAIACRILRTLQAMQIHSVAVWSDADRHSRHVRLADEAVHLGPAPPAQSYLRADLIIAAALERGAQAIHPGYGLLSENAAFAEQCRAAGIAFIGPTPQQMRDFGLKHRARALARAQGIALLPGSELLSDVEHALRAAAQVGYPLMLKSTAGGGGIGMQLCRDEAQLRAAFTAVARLARSNFGDGGMFLERYVERARHIEVQIFGDGRGRVLPLGERDCSVQRRNQKVIEETPAPHLTPRVRTQLLECAQRLGAAVSYRSAGTVEFLYDAERSEFYFLEVNTRLQVEHGVTEQVTGIDLVEWMLRLAGDCHWQLPQWPPPARGHSIQVRLYAEDPLHDFRPCSGVLSRVSLADFGPAPLNPASLNTGQLDQGRLDQAQLDQIRVDHWIEPGTVVSPHYDPLLAKIIAHGETREAALSNLSAALSATAIDGIETNLEYLRTVLADAVFREGRQFTRYLAGLRYQPRSLEVVQPGTFTTVQEYPGRLGYWDVGVPPSGPMDDLALRLANRLVGNASTRAGLECTVSGPTLRFNTAGIIALTGARMAAQLDGVSVPYYAAISVPAGATLELGGLREGGQRTYLAVRGGLDVPHYLGSGATFTLGQFGGHAGRTLRAGDTLRLGGPHPAEGREPFTLSAQRVPTFGNSWHIAVMYGPHAAPDFFTEADIEAFFAARWQVHYNSSRTGIRLIGPKPRWARSDGGEAGLHPSNIHDVAYALGAVDFTGDMPVILGPDGPSLGGFVCPVTVVRAERWKLGQLRPGDQVQFHVIDMAAAAALERRIDACLDELEGVRDGIRSEDFAAIFAPPQTTLRVRSGAVLARHATELSDAAPEVCYRQAGDKYLLVEYGPPVLDLELRLRVYALMQWLHACNSAGIAELTPGIRSLQIHYDNRQLPQAQLLTLLERAEQELPALDAIEVASRIVHLPLSWDDPATRQAIEKYMQSVRADAPWCPSNLEFIRRINGLASIDAVRHIVFEASYLVLGLGDVYLGAPVATPLDPRHRLVTTKYNPARTWTPENAVGIGGAYLCVYGMEGPGGYQFVGRTLQMWNRDRTTPEFEPGKPWLLRCFDQIRFYPVSAAELLALREDFPYGKVRLRIEPSVFKLSEYRQFLRANAQSIQAFKAAQQAAFDAERERWRVDGQLSFESEPAAVAVAASASIPPGCNAVSAPLSGNLWQLLVEVGQQVAAGQELLIIESMKMEIPLRADAAARVTAVLCVAGRAVTAGDTLLILEPVRKQS